MFKKSFLRNPIERQSTKKRIATWMLIFLTNRVKKGKRLPKWTNRYGLIEYGLTKDHNFHELNKWEDNYIFDPIKFVFLDFLKIEDIRLLADNILKLKNKGKVFTSISSNDTEADTYSKIKGLDEIYKGEAYGSILTLKPSSKVYDYIDSINVKFQKTSQSFIILHFEVIPSTKFTENYYEMFRSNSFTEKELIFNNVKNIFKQKNLIYTISTSFKYPVDKINKLYNDLNYQVKVLLKGSVKNCFYSNSVGLLYPYIAIYRYDHSQFKYYRNELEKRNGICIDGSYISEDGTVLIADKESFYAKEHNQPLNIIFDKNCEKDLDKTNIYTINIISDSYIHYITPFWITINYLQYLKSYIARTRNDLFRYLQKENDSVYLHKGLTLKKKMLEKWLILKRFNSDMRPSQNIFFEMHSIPKMSIIEGSRFRNNYSTIQDQVKDVSEKLIEDVSKSFQDLIDIFQQTGNDNVIKSNMVIQKRVIWLTILSLIASLYGANKDWVHNIIIKLCTQLKVILINLQ